MESHLKENEAPEDKNNFAYLCCVLYGIGGLMPWNSVLTAIDFFSGRLSPYEMPFTTTLVVNTPNFLL